MTLSQLDLDLMEYSDKTLKFWCIIRHKESDNFIKIFECVKENDWWFLFITSAGRIHQEEIYNDYEIYWCIFWRGRVCMLYRTYYPIDVYNKYWEDERYTGLQDHFYKNPELYDMDCLSWDDETKSLVLNFLTSLSIKK